MSYLYSVVLVVHILVGLAVIGLVLLQHGKGADMGAAFGSGASGSLFGASGSANFLSRTTAILAATFFLTSLGLSYLASSKPTTGGSVMEKALIDAEPAKTESAIPGETAKPDVANKEAASVPAAPAKEGAGKEAAAKDSAAKEPTGKDSAAKDIPK